MKKSFSKVFIVFAVLFMNASLFNSVLALTDKVPIDFESLPKVALSAIEYNWPSTTIVAAVKEGERYEVLLSDDTQVEFDKKGNWLEAECSDGLPETIIPVEIRIYIANRYPHVLITEIKRKLDKKAQPQRYEVETANGMDLIFDKNGKFVRID